jgi:WD40 repeat protein
MVSARWSLILWAAASCCLAAEPEIDVYCPAVGYDNHDDRGRNVRRGPHPVVLMLRGRIRRIEGASDAKKAADALEDSDERLPEGTDVEIVVERVFFGSPPDRPIRLKLQDGERLPNDSEKRSWIYGLVGGESTYGLDGYYAYDRRYDVRQEKEVLALAQARLDEFVLSSKFIVLGSPISGQVQPDKNEILIERVLHGPLKAGERIFVKRKESLPIPLSGGGPFVYFISHQIEHEGASNTFQIRTRWSPSTIDGVLASLKRRGNHPIREKIDEYGRLERHQEILFLGPRTDAMEFLGARNKTIQILAARRLIHDGEKAIPEVRAEVERNIWSQPTARQEEFLGQANLIRLLSVLENHRADGIIVKLIDEILTKVEGGATFPARPQDGGDERKFRRGRYGYRNTLDESDNHSLAWLLLTLQEVDAARLFGQRLLKLRDITAYGWKDEAPFVLDESHIEDHLELAKVEPRCRNIESLRWLAGFQGQGLDHYKTVFSPDGKWFGAVGSEGRVWSTVDWSRAGKFRQSASVNQIAFSRDGSSLFVAGGAMIAILDRWDWRAGKVAQRYPGFDRAVTAIQLSSDGSKLFVSSRGYERSSTIVFNTETADQVQKFPGEGWDDIAMHADGKRFVARRGREWYRSELVGGYRQKLALSSLKLNWATDDRLWSLEINEKAQSIKPEKDKDDRFSRPSFSLAPLQPSIVRLRHQEGAHSILLERPLSFAATELLVANDGNTIVVLDQMQVEVFTSPDWRSAASWRLPMSSRELHDRSEYQISPDGHLLAVARTYQFPSLFDVKTGKPVALGPAHSGLINSLEFSVNGAELTSIDEKRTVCRWNAASGKLLERRELDPSTPTVENEDRFERESFLAEDGKLWTFLGKEDGMYRRPTSFEIRVRAKSPRLDEEQDFEDNPEKAGKLLGVIEPKWEQTEPLGLVPGGKFLHAGTNVYSRGDVKLISAVNVSGEIRDIVFSADGSRYILVTSEVEERPSPLGIGVRVLHDISQRLRVHNTLTGETLFSTPAAKDIRLVVFSPDQTKVAIVNVDQEIEVWPLPK